eukprot:scaffold4329_cov115-Cylindrotheca_fusiformis.AAC.4
MTATPPTGSSYHSAVKSGKRPAARTRRDPITQLQPYDILSGRSWEAWNNMGNRRFRVTIEMNLRAYNAVPSKTERSIFIASLVRMLRDDIGARFLKKEGDHYVEIDEKDARNKVGHALRDMSKMARKQHESVITMDRKISNAVALTKTEPATKVNEPPNPLEDCLPDGCNSSNLRDEQEPMRDQSSEQDYQGWLSDLFS